MNRSVTWQVKQNEENSCLLISSFELPLVNNIPKTMKNIPMLLKFRTLLHLFKSPTNSPEDGICGLFEERECEEFGSGSWWQPSSYRHSRHGGQNKRYKATDTKSPSKSNLEVW